MKNLFEFIGSSEFNTNGFESLSENEMFDVRGGSQPIKPISRPRDEYDDEN